MMGRSKRSWNSWDLKVFWWMWGYFIILWSFFKVEPEFLELLELKHFSKKKSGKVFFVNLERFKSELLSTVTKKSPFPSGWTVKKPSLFLKQPSAHLQKFFADPSFRKSCKEKFSNKNQFQTKQKKNENKFFQNFLNQSFFWKYFISKFISYVDDRTVWNRRFFSIPSTDGFFVLFNKSGSNVEVFVRSFPIIQGRTFSFKTIQKERILKFFFPLIFFGRIFSSSSWKNLWTSLSLQKRKILRTEKQINWSWQ